LMTPCFPWLDMSILHYDDFQKIGAWSPAEMGWVGCTDRLGGWTGWEEHDGDRDGDGTAGRAVGRIGLVIGGKHKTHKTHDPKKKERERKEKRDDKQ